MVTGGGDDGVELEAMLKDSFSWHPCQVSLRSTGFGLIVQFGDSCLEEIISDKEGVLARVRVRSSPLQGDDCSSIQLGDHVLAVKNSDAKGVFYDAQVEKAIRVRHSKRTHCRCSFTIKWLHQVPEGEVLTVPAAAIMKLARKDINLHPTISAFFDMLDSSSGMDALPFSTTVDGMSWEIDINVLLERQIEEISNSSNVVAKKNSRNCVFGLKVDLNKEYHDMEADASFKDPCIITHLPSNLKGSSECEYKRSIETSRENHTASIPSIREELASRSPLNPLAARAALALSRSKFSQGAELSAQINVEKGDITSESGKFSAVGRSSVSSAASDGKNSKYEGVVKTLFPIPTPGFTEIAEYSNVPSRAQVKGMAKKKKNSEKKIIQPSGTRLTRAQLQRNSQTIETHETQWRISSETRRVTRSTVDGAEKIELEANNATEVNISSKHAKLDSHAQNAKAHESSSQTRRVTRSTVDGAEKIELKANNATEEKILSKRAKLDSHAQTTTYPQRFCPDNKNSVASPSDTEANTPSSEIENSLLKKDAKVESWKGAFVEDAVKNNFSKRLTRSVAREEDEKNNLPGVTKISAQSTEGREKKRKTSIPVKTTPNSSESVVNSSQGTKKKFATSKKSETRFSPRLNSLPQTRSQTKA